jgi:serine/threonine protein kinase
MQTEHGKFTGRTISNYAIQKLLGKGAMGEAYRADFLLHKNTPIVVKFLHHVREDSLQKFQQEAKIHALLSHPNIGNCSGQGLQRLLK